MLFSINRILSRSIVHPLNTFKSISSVSVLNIASKQNFIVKHNYETNFDKNHLPKDLKLLDDGRIVDSGLSQSEVIIYVPVLSNIELTQSHDSAFCEFDDLELQSLHITNTGHIVLKKCKSKDLCVHNCNSLVFCESFTGNGDLKGLKNLTALKLQGASFNLTDFVEKIDIAALYAEDLKILESKEYLQLESPSEILIKNLQSNAFIETSRPVNISIDTFSGNTLEVFSRIGSFKLGLTGQPLPSHVEVSLAEGDIHLSLSDCNNLPQEFGATIQLKGNEIMVNSNSTQVMSETDLFDHKEIDLSYGNPSEAKNILWLFSTKLGRIKVDSSTWWPQSFSLSNI